MYLRPVQTGLRKAQKGSSILMRTYNALSQKILYLTTFYAGLNEPLGRVTSSFSILIMYIIKIKDPSITNSSPVCECNVSLNVKVIFSSRRKTSYRVQSRKEGALGERASVHETQFHFLRLENKFTPENTTRATLRRNYLKNSK